MRGQVLRNFARVLRGRGIAAVCSVAATGLMANALPVEQFGLVILLHTYIMVIKGLLNFRTFEAIVRFGIPLQDNGELGRLESLLRATLVIDWAACLAATLFGVAGAAVAATMLRWSPELAAWAPWYALLLLTTASNTSSGILRLHDRFDALGVQYAVGPAARLALVAITWALGGTMFWFVAAWGAAFCIGNVYMIWRGQREWRTRHAAPVWRGLAMADVRDRDSEFWRFVGVVYWQTGIDLLPKHVSTLLAGALLGPVAAGLFRLAREASTVLSQPAILLREVVFPDLTRAWLEGRLETAKFRPGAEPFRTAWIAGLAGLAIAGLAFGFGARLLGLVGPDYVAGSVLMALLLVGAALELAGAPLRASAYAMGRATPLLRVHLAGIATYVLTFLLFTPWLGLNGPGYAAIATSFLTSGLTLRLVLRPR